MKTKISIIFNKTERSNANLNSAKAHWIWFDVFDEITQEYYSVGSKNGSAFTKMMLIKQKLDYKAYNFEVFIDDNVEVRYYLPSKCGIKFKSKYPEYFI